MSDTLTSADVARLLHHPEPESAAARRKVSELVKRGLPCLPGVLPRVFVRQLVMDWIATQSRAVPPEDPPVRRGLRKARPRSARPATGLDAEIARLRAELHG